MLQKNWVFHLAYIVLGVFWLVSSMAPVQAAEYAAVVMDARTGKILHSRNASKQLYPASLTKMMTLYLAFEAVKNGEIGLDDKVRISRNAAAEPPSKIGYRENQKVRFRYLIRAAAIKSANDAATAIGEAISGSEQAFTRRMNKTAHALGMTKTHFKNAHGLTQRGHVSTAHDMTILARALLYHHHQYYNIFSRSSTSIGSTTIYNTNGRLLQQYRGADGIKTGYTYAAGYNLTASAKRKEKRIIVTLFGGRSVATRTKRVTELLDMGFKRAPRHAKLAQPPMPRYKIRTADVKNLKTVVSQSPLPLPRPGKQTETLVANIPAPRKIEADSKNSLALSTSPLPLSRPAVAEGSASADIATEAGVIHIDHTAPKTWQISLGKFPTKHTAEMALINTALLEVETLDRAKRSVQSSKSGYNAFFLNLSAHEAKRVCNRLRTRGFPCISIEP